MRIRRPILGWFALAFVALTGGEVGRAADLPPHPATLPKYDLTISIEPDQRLTEFKQRVTWTNTSARPTRELVFSFYPHYRIPEGDEFLLAKTLEMLRLQPSFGIDKQGRHGSITAARLVSADGKPRELQHFWKPTNQTALVVELPEEVAPGGAVTVELDGVIRLPTKQGRWGHWKGITFLTNALPVVVYYDDKGWHDVPFVPWHQPFWNEAGVYTATVTLPANETLACSGDAAREEPVAGGKKRITTRPFVGRDFALICSALFKEHRTTVKLPDGREVPLRCLAQAHHDFYAEEILKIAAAAIPVYSKWFGAFPADHFTLCESYFGWNGNECAGLVMIDERVFDFPQLGTGYVEYLVSHETCHQWWYNQVGTNGYAETFLDEGAATYFTHRLLDARHGKNNVFIHWPEEVKWLPNIRRENYRYAGLTGAIRRDEAQPAAAELPAFGHLAGLFSGAYDRGSKVFGLIEARLGEEAFFDFCRGLVTKYSFKVLSADGLKAELTAYAGPQSAGQWDELFTRWVYGRGMTDYAVESVSFAEAGPRVGGGAARPVRAEVTVTQSREYDEPTVLGFQFANGDGFPVRVPIGPGHAGNVSAAGVDAEVIPQGNGKTLVRVTLPSKPKQVTVDPDGVLLDANPGNNSWVRAPSVKVVPFYTFLYDNDLTNDYDRWNFTAGPWVAGALYADPWFTRGTMIGARAGAYRTQEFYGGLYSAFRTDYRDLVVGADGVIDHWPTPKTQVGFNVERRVGGPYGDTDGEQTATRAVVYGRQILRYGSSLYLPPVSYVDVFTSYQDNFLPIDRGYDPGAVRPRWSWLTGAHYRLNLYTPYWDAERGVWVDLNYAAGVADLNGRVGTQQFRAELAGTRKLPDGLGYFSDIKLAGRGVFEVATPNRGQFFALGGSTLFRGFDLAERQGSLLWATNVEARLPILRDVRWDVADHMAGLRNAQLALFYDAGAVYTNGRRVENTAHALGAGLRLDLAFFSFIERATVRFDVGKTVNAPSPVQFWFGVQQPF